MIAHINALMHPIAHIRKVVLVASQNEMAELAGVDQGTISRWETGKTNPDREQMDRIRSEILKRGLPWDDAWFFKVPVGADEAAQ